MSTPLHVAVIGAGWAGCAAAVTLARLGHRASVFEIAPTAGGRARRVMRSGLAIDNGQHLLLGAYRQTLNLIAAAGVAREAEVLERRPLAVRPLGTGPHAFSFEARPLAPPLGLLAGLVRSHGLSLADRAGVIRWFRRLAARQFRCEPDRSVASLLAEGPTQAGRVLWAPLCVAALNTPPEHASAQVFCNVLSAAFTGSRDASDFLVPLRDLSTLFPEPALRFVEQQGGQVRMKTHAVLAGVDAQAIRVLAKGELQRFDAAVLAVAPSQLRDAAGGDRWLPNEVAAAAALAHEPIATVWLGYASKVPWSGGIARLDDAPGQWLFDRSDILARARPDPVRPPLARITSVVISTSGEHEALDAAGLVAACDRQLARLQPGWPPADWSQVIVEKRATYACTPGRPRVGSALPHPRVALAGDWIDEEFPATLEAAVRSGVAAAFALQR